MNTKRKTNIELKFVYPIIGLIVLRYALSLFPSTPFWGLDFLRFIPGWSSAIIVMLSIIVALPAISNQLAIFISGRLQAFQGKMNKASSILHISIAVIFGIICWQEFISFPFFGGDGVHVLRRLFRYNVGDLTSYGQLWTEPLTVMIYSILTKLFITIHHGTGLVELSGYTNVFQTVSYICGALFIFLLIKLSKKISTDPFQQISLIISTLCCSGIIFFFGYVEYYTLLYVFGMIFIFCGVIESSQTAFPKYSSIIFLITFLIHFSAITFLPALLFLIWNWYRKRNSKNTLLAKQIFLINSVIILLAFTIYLFLNLSSNNSFFIPLQPHESQWTLFSTQHLFDVGNNIFLAAPFSVLLIILMLIKRKQLSEFRTDSQFLLIVLLYWIALCISHSAIAQDWDVYPLLGICISLLSWLLILLLKSEAIKRYLLTQLIVQPILFIVPWIYVNVDFGASLNRYYSNAEIYKGILPATVLMGFYETLRTAFAETGNHEMEVAMLTKTLQISDSPYEYYKLTRAMEDCKSLSQSMLQSVEFALNKINQLPSSVRKRSVGEDDQSKKLTLNDVYVSLLKATERLLPEDQRASWTRAYVDPFISNNIKVFDLSLFTANRYYNQKHYTEAINWYTKALNDSSGMHQTDNKILSRFYNTLAISFVKTGDEANALSAFRKSISFPEANAVAWSDYGFACYSYLRFTEAVPAFEHALAIDSTNTNALYCLGKIFWNPAPTKSTSIRLFRRLLQYEENTPRTDEVKNILLRFQNRKNE